MTRRTIKESPDRDNPGYKKPADRYVLQFLIQNGEKTFGEINEYLIANNIEYSKEGLLYLLRNLQQKRIIKKNSKKPYPTYHARDKDLINLEQIALDANSFQLETADWRIKIPSNWNDPASQLESTLRDLIYKVGLYTVYTHLHSWKLISKNQMPEKNYNIRKSWLEHSLFFPIQREIPIELLLGFIPPYLTNYNLDYKNKESLKKLLQLEEILSKMFPDDIKVLREAISKFSSSMRYD